LRTCFARNRPDASISFTRNRPDASVRLLELVDCGLAIPVDGDVLVVDQNAFSVVVAGEAEDVSKLGLLFGLVCLLVRDEAERVVGNHTVLHGISKPVLKDQTTNQAPTFFRHGKIVI
jgi:hypothetical protein